MKKIYCLIMVLILTSGCVFAMSTQEKYDSLYDALKSCSDASIVFENGTAKVHETSVGSCSYVSSFDGKTTYCNMPTSMARKYAIFKTSESLNEAQYADLKDIEKKYCKTK